MTDGEHEQERDAAYEMLMRRYGRRMSPDMADGLRGAVGSVVKTVQALRAVPLANDEAPLLVDVAPWREE